MPPLSTRRRTAAVALGSLLLGILGACGGSDESSDATGSQKAPKELKIATVGSYITIFSSLWAAQPGLDDIEKKYNTKISFESFGKGSDAQTALLGGSVQVNAGTGSPDMARAVLQDQKLVSIANIFTGSGTVFVGSKKLEKSHGTSITAFKGDTWGYTAEGSTSQVSLQKVAEHEGMNWKDEKGIALGSVAAYEPALTSGRADIVAMDPTSAAKAISNGSGYEVFNTSDADAYGPVVGPLPGNGITVTQDFAKKYPELTQALATAFVEGLLKVRDVTDASEAYELLPAEFRKVHKNDEMFATEWALSQPAFAGTDGGYSKDAVDAVAKWVGVSADERNSEQFTSAFDDSYVEKAYRELGVTRATQ